MSDSIEQYEIDDPKIKDTMRKMAEYLKFICPPNHGFTLLLFNYGEGGATFYISTANRKDTITLMNEFISKQSIKQ